MPIPEADPDSAAIAPALLVWYDRHRRDLPWRARPGARPDPYHVWLSEIMLQQTTVATVGPYFRAFLARWPTVAALAAAALDDVLHAWQGLGYYARARNLHKCAGVVAGDLGGAFPETEAELRALPGIGPYTAAAVAAIAFEAPATVVDGNVERVVARLFAEDGPLPGAKLRLRALAARLTPTARAGDFAQAMMDLGATVCVPRVPLCGSCPLAADCAGRAAGVAERLPARAPKRPKPTRRGVAFWAVRGDGAVLLRRRAEAGLLGGMMEVPSTPWLDDRLAEAAAARPLDHAPVAAVGWRRLPGVVRHSFTHFHLELAVMAGTALDGILGEPAAGGVWCPPGRLGEHALPTLMKKVCRHALGQPPAK